MTVRDGPVTAEMETMSRFHFSGFSVPCVKRENRDGAIIFGPTSCGGSKRFTEVELGEDQLVALVSDAPSSADTTTPRQVARLAEQWLIRHAPRLAGDDEGALQCPAYLLAAINNGLKDLNRDEGSERFLSTLTVAWLVGRSAAVVSVGDSPFGVLTVDAWDPDHSGTEQRGTFRYRLHSADAAFDGLFDESSSSIHSHLAIADPSFVGRNYMSPPLQAISRFRLRSNDILLLASDGLEKQMGQTGHLALVRQLIGAKHPQDAVEVISGIEATLRGSDLTDDVTLVAITPSGDPRHGEGPTAEEIRQVWCLFDEVKADAADRQREAEELRTSMSSADGRLTLLEGNLNRIREQIVSAAEAGLEVASLSRDAAPEANLGETLRTLRRELDGALKQLDRLRDRPARLEERLRALEKSWGQGLPERTPELQKRPRTLATILPEDAATTELHRGTEVGREEPKSSEAKSPFEPGLVQMVSSRKEPDSPVRPEWTAWTKIVGWYRAWKERKWKAGQRNESVPLWVALLTVVAVAALCFVLIEPTLFGLGGVPREDTSAPLAPQEPELETGEQSFEIDENVRTWREIWERHGIDEDQFRSMNAAASDRALEVGRTILIPTVWLDVSAPASDEQKLDEFVEQLGENSREYAGVIYDKERKGDRIHMQVPVLPSLKREHIPAYVGPADAPNANAFIDAKGSDLQSYLAFNPISDVNNLSREKSYMIPEGIWIHPTSIEKPAVVNEGDLERPWNGVDEARLREWKEEVGVANGPTYPVMFIEGREWTKQETEAYSDQTFHGIAEAANVPIRLLQRNNPESWIPYAGVTYNAPTTEGAR